jgi:hypothetical protein
MLTLYLILLSSDTIIIINNFPTYIVSSLCFSPEIKHNCTLMTLIHQLLFHQYGCY